MDITIVGDALVDVDVVGTADRVGPEGCLVVDVDSDVRRPGGAALAAMFAARDGAAVRLVAAIGDDRAGRWLVRQLDAAGVDVVNLGLRGPTPQKWRIRAADGTLVRVDRNCRQAAPPGAAARPGDLVGSVVLVSDYGRGVAEVSLPAIAAAVGVTPVVWDPHPLGAAPPLGLDVLVPNEAEARRLARSALPTSDLPTVAQMLAGQFRCTVAVTCGPRGAVVAEPQGSPITVPARPAAGDTCGAGDRLAARLALVRGRGAPAVAAVVEGVEAASRYVATGEWSDGHGAARSGHRDPFQLAASIRAAGGRVVAAGGCFDILHAGHVELLEAARALGDCLIVCLNSDRSIRRLKGPGRPIVEEADRRRILEALQCVDAVAVFDEPTPSAVLRHLRPHVFAKGADYVAEQLPERAVLAEWGGTVAILPLAGTRSTSSLIEVVRERVS